MTARSWACIAPLAVLLAGPAAAAAAPGRLVFEGATPGPRVVTLTGDALSRWSGLVTVVVRSDARVKGRLRLRYFPRQGEPVRIVGTPRDTSPLVMAERPRRTMVRMLPHQLLAVDLRFTVPAGRSLSAIDGTLVATLYDTPRGAAAPAPAQLDVTAAVPPARFAPATVRLRVIRACWLFFGTCHSTARVTVRGEGIALPGYPGAELGSAQLRSADGTAAQLELLENDAVGDRNDDVQATLFANHFEGVGEMSGSVPLEPAAAGEPALRVDVTVGESLALAVITVFLGASLGGWLVRRAGVRRKRRLLELEVRSALERYDDEVKASKDKPASYDLSGLLEPRPRPGVAIRPYPGKDGAAPLIWHIRTAQDGPDFNDAIGQTDAMVGQIDRWIGVERVARATRALLASEPPKRGRVSFTKCLAYRETSLLLETARLGAPSDDAAAEKLRHDLADAGVLLGRWKVLWELHRALESAAAQDSRVAHALKDKDLEKQLREADEQRIERQAPPPGARTREDVARLRVALTDAARTVGEIMAEVGVQPPKTIHERVDSAAEWTAQLEDAAKHPAIPRPTKPPDAVLSRRYLLQVLRDLGWTLLRSSVAATAYALTIYDDTWGSALDFATAFTAGFASETIVNWAVMPALQSYRMRRTDETRSTEEVLAQVRRALAADPAPPGNGTPLTGDLDAAATQQ